MKKWQQIDRDVAEMPEFINSETFQVITQPFGNNGSFPFDKKTHRTDISYLASDSFHFSQKGLAVG